MSTKGDFSFPEARKLYGQYPFDNELYYNNDQEYPINPFDNNEQEQPLVILIQKRGRESDDADQRPLKFQKNEQNEKIGQNLRILIAPPNAQAQNTIPQNVTRTVEEKSPQVIDVNKVLTLKRGRDYDCSIEERPEKYIKQAQDQAVERIARRLEALITNDPKEDESVNPKDAPRISLKSPTEQIPGISHIKKYRLKNERNDPLKANQDHLRAEQNKKKARDEEKANKSEDLLKNPEEENQKIYSSSIALSFTCPEQERSIFQTHLYEFAIKCAQQHLYDDKIELAIKLLDIAEAQSQDGYTIEALMTLDLIKKIACAIETNTEEILGRKFSFLKKVAQKEAKFGDRSNAELTLALAKELTCNMDSYSKPSSIQDIALLQAEMDNTIQAKETAYEINTTLLEYTLKEIANIRVRRGDILEAEGLLDYIKLSENKCFVLINIALFHVQNGNRDGAWQSLLQARNIAYTAAPQWRPNILKSIALTLIHIGDIEGAQTTLLIAREVIDQENDFRAKLIALRQIIPIQLQMLDFEGVRETISSVKYLIGEISNTTNKACHLRDLALIQAQINDFEGAQITLSEALELACYTNCPINRPYILRKVALAQAEIGDIDRAKETANLIKEDSDKCYILLAIGRIQAQRGGDTFTQEIFAEVHAIAQTIENPSERYFVFMELSKAQTELLDTHGAQESFIKAKEAIDELENGFKKSYAYIEIALAQTRIGDIASAKITIAKA